MKSFGTIHECNIKMQVIGVKIRMDFLETLDLKNTTHMECYTFVGIIYCLLASVIKNQSIIMASIELSLHYSQYYLHQTCLQWTDQSNGAAQHIAVKQLVSA